MPVRPLPSHPSLEHLKHQAKDLRNAHAAHAPASAQTIRESHPRFNAAGDAEIFSGRFGLADAQLTIARSYGFASWARLKAHIDKSTPPAELTRPHHERIDDPIFREAVRLLDAGDSAGLRGHLKQHPNLSRQRVAFEGGNYFRNPSLLEFVAENPIRHGRLPANSVAVAKVILAAGAERAALNETLRLVCSGCVARECRVQLALIDLLCEAGADPNAAMSPALSHGEFEAAAALLQHGADLDLPAAAALGRTAEASRLIPAALAEDRHRALALAAQFGHLEIVRALLDAGEDPNRFNPVGCHSHSTPLHQAALAGDDQVVRLLVERGARVEVKDILWHGTPADWADHAGHTELAAYLRALEAAKP